MRKLTSGARTSGDHAGPGAWVDEALLREAGFGGRVLVVDGPERAAGLALAGLEVSVAWSSPEERSKFALFQAGAALAWEEHLQVQGWLTPGRRVLLYHRVRPSLGAEERAFWDAREARIREGLLRSPRLERVRAALRGGARARVDALLGEPDPTRRARMAPPSQDLRFRLTAGLLMGPGFAGRLDRALLARGPEAFAVAWLAGEAAPRRPALSRAAHALLLRLRAQPLGDALAGGGWDAIDLGVVSSPVELRVRQALAALRPGGRLAWWGDSIEGSRSLDEPCPWAPDLRVLVR